MTTKEKFQKWLEDFLDLPFKDRMQIMMAVLTNMLSIITICLNILGIATNLLFLASR